MTIEPVSRETFRQAMSRLAASVTVITTDGAAGRWGMTATAVCSVSDSPPSLLVCINQSARLHDLAQRNGVLAVNVLRADQAGLSGLFAGGDPALRFVPGDWDTGPTGAPMQKAALVSFDCRITQVIPAGSHGIFIAAVQALRVAEDGGALVYFDRSYRALDPRAV